MPNDAMLEIMKSMDGKLTRIEDKVDRQGDRLGSLEETRAKQHGIMVGGGAVVTFFSGIASWLGGHH